MEQRIPKLIHYCWLGDNKPNFILRRCISTFYKLTGGKIIRWDESCLPEINNEYISTLVARKDWGFVSDPIRLYALYTQGGVYLDTDIEVKKPLPEKFFNAELVFGYAYDDVVCTAFIMARPHHPFIKHLLDMYESFPLGEGVVSNSLFTQALMDYFPDFRLDGKYREFAPGCFIYPRYYFDSPTFRRDGGYTTHHGMGVWHQPRWRVVRWLRPLNKLARFYIKPYGVWYQERVNRKMVLSSGRFLEIYKRNLMPTSERSLE